MKGKNGLQGRSVLHLNHVVFDKISFSRNGFMNKLADKTDVQFKMGVSISKQNCQKQK